MASVGFGLKIKRLKHYLIVCSLVFVTGVVMGAGFHEQFTEFIQGQLEGIRQIGQLVADKPHPEWTLFLLILLNNSVKALLAIVLGAFGGVYPIFMLLVNGLLLGYVATFAAEQSSWSVVAKMIIPHGIVEIPAIVLACALGLRLGVVVLRMCFDAIRYQQRLPKWALLRESAKAYLPIVWMMLGALFVAAIIESTVSFRLALG